MIVVMALLYSCTVTCTTLVLLYSAVRESLTRSTGHTIRVSVPSSPQGRPSVQLQEHQSHPQPSRTNVQVLPSQATSSQYEPPEQYVESMPSRSPSMPVAQPLTPQGSTIHVRHKEVARKGKGRYRGRERDISSDVVQLEGGREDTWSAGDREQSWWDESGVEDVMGEEVDPAVCTTC